MTDRLTVHDGETPVYDIVFRRDFGGLGQELEKLGFRRVEEKINTTWSLDGEKLNEIKMVAVLK